MFYLRKQKKKKAQHKQHAEGGNTKAKKHSKTDIWNSRNLGLPFKPGELPCYEDIGSTIAADLKIQRAHSPLV